MSCYSWYSWRQRFEEQTALLIRPDPLILECYKWLSTTHSITLRRVSPPSPPPHLTLHYSLDHHVVYLNNHVMVEAYFRKGSYLLSVGFCIREVWVNGVSLVRVNLIIFTIAYRERIDRLNKENEVRHRLSIYEYKAFFVGMEGQRLLLFEVKSGCCKQNRLN